LAELDFTALIVSALYANFHDFEMFTALSRFYFAAASFSETLRRLGKTPEGFLLCEDSQFSPAVREIASEVISNQSSVISPNARAQLLEKIRDATKPFDIAGLNDSSRRNWHPVLADDLLRNHAKLSVSESDVEQMMARTGMITIN
jgi:FADH2 O2-dependent halogenase